VIPARNGNRTAALGYCQHVTVKDMPARMQRAKLPWDRSGHTTQSTRPSRSASTRSHGALPRSNVPGKRAQGPTQSQQWEGHVTLIVDEDGAGHGNANLWWTHGMIDTAMQRLHMDTRRGYMHASPRMGSHGARTSRGADTA
jgi:hypothetical protein